MTAAQAVALIIIGALAGTAAASLTGMVKRGRHHTTWLYNTLIGILGALVGSILFDAIKWTPPEFLNEPITAAEILTAFVGALIVIVVAGYVRR